MITTIVIGIITAVIVVWLLFFVWSIIVMMKDRIDRRRIRNSDQYQRLVDKYISEGHRPRKARDLAFRRLDRKLVR